MATISTLNNSEAGLSFRNKLNTNFTNINDELTLSAAQIALINEYGVVDAADTASRYSLSTNSSYLAAIAAAGGISSQPIYVYQIDQATYYQVMDAGNLDSELGYRVAGGTLATLVSTGTAGTDFAIDPNGDTYVFNLPNASPTARGVVTTGDQTLGGNKTFANTIRFITNTLTDGATITPDFSKTKYKVQLAGNRTLANPSNLGEGQSGTITVYQDGTGSRTLTPAANSFYTPLTAIPLSTGKYVKDVVPYSVDSYATATVTMTIATPCVVTWTSHGLISGDKVTFSTTGALPTGITAGTLYYVNVTGTDTFNLSTSLANLQAGTYVATSGSQSGTHTAVSANIIIGSTIFAVN